MLPPESIRFFYVDMNWVDALIDGAFSIGRNLTQNASAGGPSRLNVDKAVSPALHAQALAGVAELRARAFGLAPPAVSLKAISGFLLRSSVVVSCPGIGVYCYDSAGGPLTMLRFERLGPTADTLICLVDGDLARAEIHEPPESLHYGIDQYAAMGGPVQASKEIHTFTTRPGGNVDLNPTPESKPIGEYFRKSSPRTLRIRALSVFIAGLSGLQQLDSAQMGFEMTQGVGLVSFVKRSA
jgi:hypothetical protein